jgi:hypothetical protein
VARKEKEEGGASEKIYGCLMYKHGVFEMHFFACARWHVGVQCMEKLREPVSSEEQMTTIVEGERERERGEIELHAAYVGAPPLKVHDVEK